jgi:hypothetical protein
MKCLNRIEMQEYIDKEVDPVIEIEMQNHLKTCEKCASLFNEALNDKAKINKLVGQVGPIDEADSIPEFKFPVIRENRSISFRFVLITVAASLIGFILLFHFEKEPLTAKVPEAEILIYEFYDGKDLNKLWHDKAQILIIQDEKGNVIQSTITY